MAHKISNVAIYTRPFYKFLGCKRRGFCTLVLHYKLVLHADVTVHVNYSAQTLILFEISVILDCERRGFCTSVLHLQYWVGLFSRVINLRIQDFLQIYVNKP